MTIDLLKLFVLLIFVIVALVSALYVVADHESTNFSECDDFRILQAAHMRAHGSYMRLYAVYMRVTRGHVRFHAVPCGSMRLHAVACGYMYGYKQLPDRAGELALVGIALLPGAQRGGRRARAGRDAHVRAA